MVIGGFDRFESLFVDACVKHFSCVCLCVCKTEKKLKVELDTTAKQNPIV